MVNHLDPETDRKIRRLIAGEVSFEEGKKDKPTALMKLSANPIFDLFIIAMIILNLCLLATDNPEILWGDQSSRRLNLFLLCDVRPLLSVLYYSIMHSTPRPHSHIFTDRIRRRNVCSYGSHEACCVLQRCLVSIRFCKFSRGYYSDHTAYCRGYLYLLGVRRPP